MKKSEKKGKLKAKKQKKIKKTREGAGEPNTTSAGASVASLISIFPLQEYSDARYWERFYILL